jgi:uncharacterized protein
MAVVTLYMSDRDKSQTFTDKKEADAYDKMLELADAFRQFIEREIADVSEEKAEEIGLAFAKNAQSVAAAIKGRTEALLAETDSADKDKDDSSTGSNLSVVNE